MPLEFSLSGSDARLSLDLKTKLSVLGPALIERMTLLMRQLQAKAQGKAPRLTGGLASRIRDPRAEIQGTAVVGHLTWGGDVQDYVLEFGGKKTYVINPQASPAERRRIAKGTLKPSETSGKHALRFDSQRLGKEVFAAYVFHPPIAPRHFMAQSAKEMERVIVDGLLDEIKKKLKR